ncbi:DUF2599 domain-containing protein [Mycolicibacterium celeriflavum]|uniref:DUF2599 domain-containing protein n=1 Tax=Mycolicibacterium celeriflavum TaxID=1249101 RepID=UPI003CEDC260
MRFGRMIAVAAAVTALLPGAVVAHAQPPPPRPPGSPDYIDHTVWEYHGDRATLRIYPTPWGWAGSGPFSNGAQSYDAWAELLEHAPDANTLSMQNQFMCYWQLSTFTNPGKVGTWNLEPWRPVVSNRILQNSGCNPGGPDDVLNW